MACISMLFGLQAFARKYVISPLNQKLRKEAFYEDPSQVESIIDRLIRKNLISLEDVKNNPDDAIKYAEKLFDASCGAIEKKLAAEIIKQKTSEYSVFGNVSTIRTRDVLTAFINALKTLIGVAVAWASYWHRNGDPVVDLFLLIGVAYALYELEEFLNFFTLLNSYIRQQLSNKQIG